MGDESRQKLVNCGKGVGKVGIGKAEFGEVGEPTEKMRDVLLRVVNPETGLFELDQRLKGSNPTERRRGKQSHRECADMLSVRGAKLLGSGHTVLGKWLLHD